MLDFDSDDIALLFNKLIVLPSDRQETVNAIEMSSSAEAIAEEKPEIVENKIEHKSQDTSELENTAITKHPFIVITSEDLKSKLNLDSSNFRKIITALNIDNTIKYLQPLNSINLEQIQYNCIWCVGLSAEEEEKVRSAQHGNILYSPNMENLKSKEEKIAMFTPLKSFVSENLELLTKL